MTNNSAIALPGARASQGELPLLAAPATYFLDDELELFPCGSQRAADRDHRRQTERRKRLEEFIAS